ncbi:type II secretion system F family protein [Candidatus Woesearchaeota archaeon]|nr:type II secretion system F family protein [Candidatus Woesearchaeota archaeon]
MVVVPFSILPPKVLYSLSTHLMEEGKVLSQFFPNLQLEIDRADISVDAKRYLAECLTASLFLVIFFTILLTIVFIPKGYYFSGAMVAIAFSIMIFFLQINYPNVVAHRRIRKLDADLLGSLRAILIQINSGVPLFEAMVIISKQQFGEVSSEFRKVVNKINVGVPQIEALESMALKNPSPYFRRTLWQIINAMKEGAASATVMESVISNLNREEIIQIEKYGSQLSPLAMFYMMGAVIMPVLAVTLIIVMSSFIQIDDLTLKILFFSLLGLVVFFQLMFSGVIKSKRPSLLGE